MSKRKPKPKPRPKTVYLFDPVMRATWIYRNA